MLCASIVQWLEYLPSKQVARVRFPVDAFLEDVPVAKWIRRRFPEPKIEGSSPFRDASFQRTSGLVGYDVCLTRRRSPVRSRACVFLLVPVFVFDSKCKRVSSHRQALIAQMVERKTLNLVVVGSIPTGGAFVPLAPVA